MAKEKVTLSQTEIWDAVLEYEPEGGHPAVSRMNSILISLFGWDGFNNVMGALTKEELAAVEDVFMRELSIVAKYGFDTMPAAQDVRRMIDSQIREVFPGLWIDAIRRAVKKEGELDA